MNFKRISVLGVFLLAFILTAGSVWAEEEKSIQQREANQDIRIDAGSNRGTVTAEEKAQLDAGQARLEANRKKAWQDGDMSAKEHRRLERQANRQSRKIHRKKGNNKTVSSELAANSSAAPN